MKLRGDKMSVSYKRLWKILIDKDMKKKDLQIQSGVSWGVISKLSKNETVNMESLIKICRLLNCTVDEVMEILPDKENTEV
jgi:DNA-binding Xre family transcriptional regulator